jgi:hypothetical protein
VEAAVVVAAPLGVPHLGHHHRLLEVEEVALPLVGIVIRFPAVDQVGVPHSDHRVAG